MPRIMDGCLFVRGNAMLSGLPENVAVAPVTASSAFLGATSTVPSSRHVFSLGVLKECRFLSLFRFKIWWMIPRVGKSGSEILMETQMLLLETREDPASGDEMSPNADTENIFFILLLPVLDGKFRTSLQGTPANELQFCAESGDANVQTSQTLEAVFINSGDNPFELIRNSIKILEEHNGTFCHINNKKVPAYLEWFGWCTWDAFYREVNPQGIIEGLESFSRGGCSPKFLIIDDGWQDAVNEFHKEGEPFAEGTQFAFRLVNFKENGKFRSSGSNNTCSDLHELIDIIKEKYGIKYVYMWHALAGYWGGVFPPSEIMKKYNPKGIHPIQSPGNMGNLRDVAMDSLEKYGVGIIDPEKIFDFFNDFHCYLASCGVDGVKVDIQNVIETLGDGYGGRVVMTRRYIQALEQSVGRNFKENNVICSMSHNSDSIYSSMKSAVTRTSEDFVPGNPAFQTLHVASDAFNSLFLGEFAVPDWDMFHSKHNSAEFHGAARAIGGCGVYVSHKPGNHDFNILRKLVLPDGSILRARYAGRPTRDCLFVDPVTDGKSLLKIWNMNKIGGVVGVFNCQGAGSWPWPLKQVEEKAASTVSSLSCHASPMDVEFLEDVAVEDWNGDCAIYAFNSRSVFKLPKNGNLQVSLGTLEYEIYTISPIIRAFGEDILFAPVGLVDMYNSGGAAESMSVSGCRRIKIRGRGCGRFGVYSSIRPRTCEVDLEKVDFAYNDDDEFLTLTLKLQLETQLRDIEFFY